MDVGHEAILRVFLAEAEESFLDLEEALIRLESYPDDEEALGTLFRRVHSLKGDASSLGFERVTAFAHAMENVLDRLRSHALFVGRELVTVLLRCIDELRRMVPAAPSGGDVVSEEGKALLDQLAAMLGGGALDLPEAEARQQGVAPTYRPGGQARTLRVDVEKLDRMLGLVGEIIVARNRMGRALASEEGREGTREGTLEMAREGAPGRSEMAQSQEETDRLFTELRSTIMQARMVPIGHTFRGYTRAVRDLAGKAGKIARLKIEGQEVEVDTRIVEQIRDPLTHMIGNAIGHGIEPPAARVAAGKDPCGRIVLRARHAHGAIVVEVADDGAGLDRGKILEQARALGLVGEGAEPPDEELFQCVFHPGFSTAQAITTSAGRGVGMDVVRRNVEAVRGSVSIESRAREGCTITLRLPLTLAIIEGFTVGVGTERYVLPLDAIQECIDLPERERENCERRGVINLRGRPLPYLRLRALLRVGGAAPVRESVVVVEHEGKQVGLVVDELEGKSQMVIKPLGPLLQGLPGLSGSTILEDGEVALILDVGGVCRLALQEGAHGGLGPHGNSGALGAHGAHGALGAHEARELPHGVARRPRMSVPPTGRT
ncbi:chemotaxis protein CheA [Chondromyces apiculatus]|uniref:Chemotaxis protein CheA n=1 Tax=Chondromyces apiculatus DSM 436 TaxID=1192034 RepID=A0A017T218_9BACT|nr:chemotaxis protein CheA [Chondromyces apiculatus]EYF02561.1 Signal transduction histidine kinase CheA [Chondromyces apiculatus DSM 436]